MSQGQVDEGLEELLTHLKEERGFDFTGYKRASLSRRIRKRMGEIGVEDYDEYRKVLHQRPAEYIELFNTILINVTEFMRDPAGWEYLATTVIPRILEEKEHGDPIRAWSAGCASGEETYSIAILLAEALGDDRFRRDVKVYGSDLDDEAIAQARTGRYPLRSLEQGLSPEQIDRYFERGEGGYTFRKDLRRSVIFGRHDLVQDPPIGRVDLLVCRNTLMYFNADVQRRILASFNFALNEGGFLYLGKSEALVTRTNLFTVEDVKHHVFVKGKPRRRRRPEPAAPPADPGGARTDDGNQADPLAMLGLESLPTAVMLVERDGALVLANRRARMLFNVGPGHVGRPFHELEVSYRPVELRSRIEQAIAERRAITIDGSDHDAVGPAGQPLEIHVEPFGPPATPEGVTIMFTEIGRYRDLEQALERSRNELETAYEELQSTVEELETTNEELQSTNEELETTNEELHSTNEELETMNEELQSTNEELETINSEFGRRTDELDQANAYLNAILGGLGSAVVVLDKQMAVRIWNVESAQLWGLRADEVDGQHFLNLDIGLPVDRLKVPIREVLRAEDGPPKELVVDAVNRRGKAFRCRVVVARLDLDDDRGQGIIIRMEAAPES